MTIYKAYKFRMYPNNEQEKVLNSFLGSSRFIFNYYLKLKDKLYKENSINYKLTDMKKDLVPLQTTYPWLKEVDGCILRTTLEDLDRAFDNFYSKRASYPKYKKYGKNESYRTVCIKGNYKGKEYQSIKVDLKNKKIKLPKIKEEIRIRGYRNLKDFNSYILNATITKEAGRYYVSVCRVKK